MPKEQRGAEYAVDEIIGEVIDRIINPVPGSLDRKGGDCGGDNRNNGKRPETQPSPIAEYSLLWNAVATGDIGRVRSILKASIDDNMLDWHNESGVTALMKVGEINSLQIAKLLLKSGIKSTNLNSRNGRTALHLVSSLGLHKILKYMLKYTPEKDGLDRRDNDGNTALHSACVNGHYKCAKILFEGGPTLR
ncbi:uncharacterized protein DFL_003027 [Arthrobotrys flagrans]|uniref:Uncharacterized protein n=1 Tax=Arthrobotrys flagrans TaxID=97331 RepID=A0A437ACJ2_ARTFL|nr:hypothetical protein DFL_003027 [Arthrobotrys flagrans]